MSGSGRLQRRGAEAYQLGCPWRVRQLEVVQDAEDEQSYYTDRYECKGTQRQVTWTHHEPELGGGSTLGTKGDVLALSALALV